MRLTAAGVTFLVLALMGFSSRPDSGAKKSATPQAPDRPASSLETIPEEVPGPQRIICDHFGKAPDCLPTLRDSATIQTLIATVPDPRRTDLPLYFDRMLDSLLWAAADADYKFEGYWLPWSVNSTASTSSVESTPKPAANRNSRFRTSEPGAFIFHKGVAARPQLLVIFVVGETVTGGLDREAFIRALGYVHELTSQPQDVWIVGPTFSGTFDSLENLIADDQSKRSSKVRYHVMTGTATHLHSHRPAIANSATDFGSVVENDVFAFHAFLDYLWERWGNPGEISLLAEDQTAYGRLAEQLVHIIESHSGRQYRHEQWLFLRFPYGISRLRNSYEKEPAASTLTNEKATPAVPATQQSLPFNLGSSNQESDSVPAFSKVQSPLSQEAVLVNIASSLEREQVRYVGIVATDVLDAVFLARFLRKTCPDVRIFMFDADLLFARAELSTPLEGILNITTYPLFGRNQHWTQAEISGAPPRRTTFASRYAEGEYNATRAQLWNMGQGEETNGAARANPPGEILLDYHRPDSKYPGEARPPLWLTVLGRDGYWPVALLDKVIANEPTMPDTVTSSLVHAPSTPPAPGSEQEELHPESPSHFWTLLLAGTAIVGILHSLFIWLVYLHPRPKKIVAGNAWGIWKGASAFLYRFFGAYPRATADSARTNPDLPGRATSEALQCPRLLVVGTLILACAQVVFATSGIPYVFRGGPKPWADYLYFFVPVVTLAILLMAALSVSTCPGGNRTLGKLSWAAWVVFNGLWVAGLRGYNNAEQSVFFFAYRMAHPRNGVSPAVPVVLLLGALFAWAFMLLARRATVPPPRVPSLREPAHHAARLNRQLSHVVPLPGFLLSLAVVVLWGFLFHGIARLRSVETVPYDLLILFLLAICYGLLFGTWAQLIGAWIDFRRFLESLERHTMRAAFSRVPKELATLPLFQREPQKADLFTSGRCADTADALLRELGKTPFAEAFVSRVNAMHACMRVATRQSAAGLRVQPSSYKAVSAASHALEQSVLGAANDLIIWTRQQFWHEGSSDGLDREISGRAPNREITAIERQRILAEEFVVLRFVMYIRHVLRQMRSLLWFIVIDFILTVLALSSYPFQSHRLITVACVGILIVIGMGFVVIFAQMDRDALLSRLSESKPNEIGLPFYLRLASFGALPLLTVLATQFPSIGQFISGWLQPALEALK